MRHDFGSMWAALLAAFLGGLLAGCLDDGARDLDAFLSDPAYLESVKDDPSGPDLGPPLCSEVGNGASWRGNFLNQTMDTLAILWVRPDCGEDTMAQLPPGGSYPVNSFVGHVWRARNTDGVTVFQVKLADTTPPDLVLEVGQ